MGISCPFVLRWMIGIATIAREIAERAEGRNQKLQRGGFIGGAWESKLPSKWGKAE
jgi:hypothetical protein